MMETSTIKNGTVDKKSEEAFMENITDSEIDFYQQIAPSLDGLAKSPSDETISKILTYSKTL